MADKKKKKKQGGSGGIIFVLILLVAGGVVGSNFAGPAKGWMTGKKSDDGVPTGKVASTDGEAPGTTETDKPGDVEEPDEPVKPVDEGKSEVEKMLEKYRAEWLGGKAKTPKKDQVITLIKHDGSKERGKVVELDDYKIKLEIKKSGFSLKTDFYYDAIVRKQMVHVFPKRGAVLYANYMVEKWLKEQNKIAATPEPVATATTSSSDGKPVKVASSTKLDPSKGADSPRLKHVALEFRNYLTNQMRLMERKHETPIAFAEASNAKQHGRRAVIYVYMRNSFLKSDRGYMLQTVDGLRQFWALRCMMNGVAGASQAAIAIVNEKGNIVGGSRSSDAEQIYFGKQ